jgi:hypothetical protein
MGTSIDEELQQQQMRIFQKKSLQKININGRKRLILELKNGQFWYVEVRVREKLLSLPRENLFSRFFVGG